ncbi:NAD(P)H-binding protein [Sphaerisporangium sp. B11E5]|uniref:NAD(P)-dependent oxidoreductase n=1 Tax=Sphaerisporangium sp. B11E5 TaxID=3153563 RepID=UPI00325E3A36
MKITVFGGTGRTGQHIVRQALDAGHEVAAVVRDPARLPISHSALEVITADLTAPAPLRPALTGREAVISAIGPRTRKDVGVTSNATRVILRAMDQTDIRRIVLLSAVPVGPIPEGENPIFRVILYPLLRRLLRDAYADLAAMEEEARRSTTEWTVIRPPRLTDKPLTERYRREIGGNVPRGHFLSRADLAHAMLAALDDPATVKQPVGVAY